MNKKSLAFLLSFAACGTAANAQLVINEIMQSNVDCIMVDNEFPDSWVELYNAGTSDEKLSDYKLGESDDPNAAFKLGNSGGGGDWGWGWGGGWWPGGGGDTGKTLKAKERVLIYCDKNGKDLHTDFRLETAKGCTLFLFKNDKIVDQLPDDMKKQPAPNIAFGRKTDGSDEWGYLLTPTPDAANCGEIVGNKDILPDPEFSVAGRVFKPGDSFEVELTLPEGSPEGAQIRYTTDGSEPTEKSTLYTSAIKVSATTILRAKPFLKGWLSPRSTTHSYIALNRDVTLGVVSLTSDSKFFYDNSTGILVEKNASNKDIKWRRPLNVEFFDEANLDSAVINQICETRLSGNWTRRFALRTMAVYAHKRFGTKHIKYELFPDQKPGIDKFKSILLRNSGNDFSYTYMRDAVVQRQMAANRDVDWQAWRPVIVFINGEYKGMLNIRERSNEDNMYSNYDGLEDVDFVENWGQEFKAGDQQTWYDFQNFYGQTHTYAQWDERLDVLEFLDGMILNILHCNLDFPGNNCALWRPQLADGRWRMQLKDIDYALGIYDRKTNTAEDIYEIKVNYNYIKWLNGQKEGGEHSATDNRYTWGNGDNATRLFKNLMKNADAKREFVDRFAIYMGDFLGFDEMWADTWGPMCEKIAYEYRFHRSLYKQSWDDYEKELEKAKTWLQKRIPIVYEQLSSYYQLGTPKPLTINKGLAAEDLDGICIKFNDVTLNHSDFDGMFYASRKINLEGDENVNGWNVTFNNANGPQSHYISGSTYSFSIPASCTSVEVNADIIPNDIIAVTDNHRDDTPVAIYDASGRRRNSLAPGLNIIRTADGRTIKKMVK